MFSNITFLLMMFMATIVLIWGMYLIHTKTALVANEDSDMLLESKLSESKAIRYAAKSGGRISVAALCMKAEVSTEQAQQVLEELQEKGIFEVSVSESGTVYYELTDKDLIESK